MQEDELEAAEPLPEQITAPGEVVSLEYAYGGVLDAVMASGETARIERRGGVRAAPASAPPALAWTGAEVVDVSGDLAVAAYAGRLLRFVDLAAAADGFQYALIGNAEDDPVDAIAVTPSAGVFVAAGEQVRVWSPQRLSVRRSLRVPAGAWAVSADGRVFAASDGARVELRALPGGASIGGVNTRSRVFALSPDGDELAVAERDEIRFHAVEPEPLAAPEPGPHAARPTAAERTAAAWAAGLARGEGEDAAVGRAVAAGDDIIGTLYRKRGTEATLARIRLTLGDDGAVTGENIVAEEPWSGALALESAACEPRAAGRRCRARITSASRRAVTPTVELWRDGALVARHRPALPLPAGATADVAIDVGAGNDGALVVVAYALGPDGGFARRAISRSR